MNEKMTFSLKKFKSDFLCKTKKKKQKQKKKQKNKTKQIKKKQKNDAFDNKKRLKSDVYYERLLVCMKNIQIQNL